MFMPRVEKVWRLFAHTLMTLVKWLKWLMVVAQKRYVLPWRMVKGYPDPE